MSDLDVRPPLLAAEAVTFGYGARTVLSDVSVSIAAGGSLGLVGESGAGKTTLLRLLLGLQAPTSGRVVFDGAPLALGDRRANAVKNYLVALGIGSERILTISYGEERPAEPGHDEAAWAQNRRAVTVVAATG